MSLVRGHGIKHIHHCQQFGPGVNVLGQVANRVARSIDPFELLVGPSSTGQNRGDHIQAKFRTTIEELSRTLGALSLTVARSSSVVPRVIAISRRHAVGSQLQCVRDLPERVDRVAGQVLPRKRRRWLDERNC